MVQRVLEQDSRCGPEGRAPWVAAVPRGIPSRQKLAQDDRIFRDGGK
jgi:hypothetical protein